MYYAYKIVMHSVTQWLIEYSISFQPVKFWVIFLE